MLEGKLLIDGKDALVEYGVFVSKGYYKGIIQRPAFKSPKSTDWLEEDGQEYDLLSPVLDTRSVQIQFHIKNIRYAEDLFDDLSTGAYHTFYFADLKKTYKLRMSQNGTFKQLVKLGTITLTFYDDFPEVPTGTPYKIGKSDVRQVGYELDGSDMSQFGAYVLKDSDASIRKAANTKENLKISISNVAGVTYDDQSVHFKTKDVTLKLLINAVDIDEFWKRENALYACLLQSEERLFYYRALEVEYNCFYKSSSVSKFEILPNGHVWCEFSIVLTFVDYRPTSQYQLLATEDFDYVCTEDGEALIRIRPKRGISLIICEDGAYLITENTEDTEKIYINN